MNRRTIIYHDQRLAWGVSRSTIRRILREDNVTSNVSKSNKGKTSSMTDEITRVRRTVMRERIRIHALRYQTKKVANKNDSNQIPCIQYQQRKGKDSSCIHLVVFVSINRLLSFICFLSYKCNTFLLFSNHQHKHTRLGICSHPNHYRLKKLFEYLRRFL